jgi:photosystem II stability/assembly factor-like uncharacterized protein
MIGVTCPSSTLCLTSGVTANPDGPYSGAILASIDGGTTWQVAQLPTGTLGIGSVVCPSATQCIAAGAALLVSNDGGLTWTDSSVSGGTQALRSIVCLRATTCIAVGANPQGATATNASAVAIMTTNGGESWTQATLPAGSAFLDQIDCVSATQCVAAGPGTIQGGPAAFFTTENGGSTWATSPSPPSSLSLIAGISCSSLSTCAVVGREGNNQPATSSTTNGTTWSTQPLTGEATPPTTEGSS